jgi:excisionase family DNA binding protein
MPSNPRWTGPVGRLWTQQEIAADGGPKKNTLYLLIAAGEIEAVKMGSRLRITDRSYQAWKENLPRGVTTSPFAA